MASYNSLETSNHSSKPVALYEFNLGTTTWKYVAAEYAQTYESGTYQPTTITDEGISQSGQPDNEEVRITLPRSLPVADLYRIVPPSEPVFVVMRRANRGSTEAPVVWVGTIKAAKIVGRNQLQFTGLMMAASFKRQGLRLTWQRTCPYALYDRSCKVDPALYATPLTIDSLSGTSLFASALDAQPTDRFSGGYVEWPTVHGTFERRGIEDHVGTMLTLLELTDGLTVGQQITAYPGCARTVVACQEYNNFSNYGGFPHLPGKSPFDGDPVF